jgi:predicted XRE-type DNA-binding protein
MVKKQEPDIPVTPSSGNVFTDLGFAEPEEELTKAQLASHIRQIIKRRHLTQVGAAALMGVDQPKVSALLNGRLANFSSERLMRLLTALGQDVEIVVKAKPRHHERGRIRVVGERLSCACAKMERRGAYLRAGVNRATASSYGNSPGIY